MSKYDKDAFRAHGAMSTSKTNDAHLTSAQVVEILLNPDDPKQVLPNLFKKIRIPIMDQILLGIPVTVSKKNIRILFILI